MRVSAHEQRLGVFLKELPRKYGFKWMSHTRHALIYELFRSLVEYDDGQLKLLFPQGLDEAYGPWNLAEAQGAQEGAEYLEGARGKRCGHIFKNGETTYSCRTCTNDETCVLCTRCFEASDHEGHTVHVSMSLGMTGCCDCGDDEAWVRPVECSIHSASAQNPADTASGGNTFKDNVHTSPKIERALRTTIAKVLDYFIDVYACAPEQMRQPKREDLIRKSERLSRLNGKRYGGTDDDDKCDEFALVLWNDEKHALDEVVLQVQKSCRVTKGRAEVISLEIDKVGRSIVSRSTNISKLLMEAKKISEIKLTVTIRSTRDLFREEMCNTIVDWLSDIAGCSVGNDHNILMNIVCEEMLGRWKIGSSAMNLAIARRGIIDHQKTDDRIPRRQRYTAQQRLRAHAAGQRELAQRARLAAQQGTTGITTTTGVVATVAVNGPRQVGVRIIAPGGIADDVQSDDDGSDDEDPLLDEDTGEDEVEVEDEDDIDEADGGDDTLTNQPDDDARTGAALAAMNGLLTIIGTDDIEDVDLDGDDGEYDENDDDYDRMSVTVFNEDDEDDDAMDIDTGVSSVSTANAARAAGLERETQLPVNLARSVDDNAVQHAFATDGGQDRLFSGIPKTPKAPNPPANYTAPHWSEPKRLDQSSANGQPLPLHEDLDRRVRIDFLILYDLRMWKQLRNNLRHLYITTVVRVGSFKRILGLRFASLYTWLAQLYLIADREPDHSIISLSLQMLTTPSITAEIVERGRFFTKLLAILYTFLTKRQVGHPEDVDWEATMAFDQGVVQNRRVHHFFSDLRFLLEAPLVQQKLRDDANYLLQFLDFIKLMQGICPSIRAVQEHVEYESEAWVNALYIVRESTYRSRQFCEAFKWSRQEDPASICRAIRQTAKVTIISSLGVERERFSYSEIKREPEFIDITYDMAPNRGLTFRIVKFQVASEPVSFTHLLHYTLSWFIEAGKSMARSQLKSLLKFSWEDLNKKDLRLKTQLDIPAHDEDQYLLAMFDFPLRVCVWISQIRGGLWIRNGHSLRAQMTSYRSNPARDATYQRDVFMLQVAFAICQPDQFLASMIDRFELTGWMKGQLPWTVVPKQFEPLQLVDMAEEMANLLVNILTDRTLLQPTEDNPNQQEEGMKRDIIHVLCFKAMSHSELNARLAPNITDTDTFPKLLNEIATYRPPEGLSDSGLFELKSGYVSEIDPYYPYFNKNQREEAENIYRAHVAKSKSVSMDDVFHEPNLKPIKSGVFVGLSEVTQTWLFGQVVGQCLKLALAADLEQHGVPKMKVESLLTVVLHLSLIAVLEDQAPDHTRTDSRASFLAFFFKSQINGEDLHSQPGTIASILFTLLGRNEYPLVSNRIRFILRHIQAKWPKTFAEQVQQAWPTGDALSLLDPSQELASTSEEAKALKKKMAAERQARVMANFKKQQESFLENQDIDWGEELDELNEEPVDVDMVEEQEAATTWHFPKDRCILCQEDTNESRLYGTLAFLTESRIFRHTDLEDTDFVSEACTVPASLDRSCDHVRPFGAASKNRHQVSKVTADGEVIITTRQGLGRGFPRVHCKRGSVITSCGHMMHWTCFKAYERSTEARHDLQLARNHPERLSRKEFVCPMCKALGNTFLPVIFKPKEYKRQKDQNKETFHNWLRSQLGSLSSRDWCEYDFTGAVNGCLSSGLLSNFMRRNPSSSSTGDSLPLNLPAFLGSAITPHDSGEARSARRAHGSGVSEASSQSEDLIMAWRRLQETILVNAPPPTTSWEITRSYQYCEEKEYDPERDDEMGDEQETANHAKYFGNVSELINTLASTITSTEIAQRGMVNINDGQALWFSGLPETQMSHLRIFSETVTAYLNTAWHVQRNAPQSRREFTKGIRRLFATGLNPGLFGQDMPEFTRVWEKGIFLSDTFTQLVECSIHIAPLLHIDLQWLVQLFFLAEIIKVVLTFVQNPNALATVLKSMQTTDTYNDEYASTRSRMAGSADNVECFSVFVQSILIEYRNSRDPQNPDEHSLHLETHPNERYDFDRLLRVVTQNYALTFLRKAALLMHLRGGIDFGLSSTPIDPDLPEIDRLSLAMKLPAFDELVNLYVYSTPGSIGECLHTLGRGWIHHHSDTCQSVPDGMVRAYMLERLQLGHPGIFELVALPTTHDNLNREALLRRCETTGQEMADPALCLLCGDFVCFQTGCCRDPRTGKGGCNTHMETCDKTIGIFLQIRKCTIVFMHRGNGSFVHAPYLDRHGETDPGLRRKELLFLNAKRYDKLFREVWLNHGVQSAIARKLESEQNNGGWETF